jgi:hypothetical protein
LSNLESLLDKQSLLESRSGQAVPCQ